MLSLQTNARRNLNISKLQPDIMYKFHVRRKINHTVGLWSDWSKEKEAKTKEEGKLLRTFLVKTFFGHVFVIMAFEGS